MRRKSGRSGLGPFYRSPNLAIEFRGRSAHLQSVADQWGGEYFRGAGPLNILSPRPNTKAYRSRYKRADES